MARLKCKQGHTSHCTPTPSPPTTAPAKHQLFYNLWFLRYSSYKIFKLKVTKAGSKVNSRSNYDIAYLRTLTNVTTMHQFCTLHGFQDIGWTRFSNSRSPRQGQRNQYHTIKSLETYTLTNVLTKYQLPTPYSFWDTAQTNFFWSSQVKKMPAQPLKAVGKLAHLIGKLNFYK